MNFELIVVKNIKDFPAFDMMFKPNLFLNLLTEKNSLNFHGAPFKIISSSCTKNTLPAEFSLEVR